MHKKNSNPPPPDIAKRPPPPPPPSPPFKICGLKCEVWSRVVGYFRPTTDWNKGKQEEYKDRTPFKINTKPAKEE